jgi:hypothetical protein
LVLSLPNRKGRRKHDTNLTPLASRKRTNNIFLLYTSHIFFIWKKKQKTRLGFLFLFFTQSLSFKKTDTDKRQKMKLSKVTVLLLALMNCYYLGVVHAQQGKEDDEGADGKDDKDKEEDGMGPPDEGDEDLMEEPELIMANNITEEGGDEEPTMECPSFAGADMGPEGEISCQMCLEAEDNCVWSPVGGCMSSCMFIADVPCYDMQYFDNRTALDVCTQVAREKLDQEICGSANITTCSECVATLRTDGETTCFWYNSPTEDGTGWCRGTGGCDMMGNCGTTVCSDDPHPCNNFPECEPCLNSRMECAWVADRCEPSCDIVPEATCFHPSLFPNMTGPEICAESEEVLAVATDTSTGEVVPGEEPISDSGAVGVDEGETGGDRAIESAAAAGIVGTYLVSRIATILSVLLM